jgi:hypothetical protein
MNRSGASRYLRVPSGFALASRIGFPASISFKAIAVAIFSRLEVLGFRQMEFELTLDAIDIGLDAAIPGVIELGLKVAEFGRGERSQNDDFDGA